MSNPFDDYDDDEFEYGDAATGAPLLSSEIDLIKLGLNDVAYVKSSTVNGVRGFTIHAADGTPMAMTVDRAMAYAAIIQEDLRPVSVH